MHNLFVHCCTGVQSVAKGCNRLQIVYLWRCANITDDAVVAIATHCRYLREINLGCCSNITDISLQAIGEHCSLLKILDFSRTKACKIPVLLQFFVDFINFVFS